MNNDLNNKFSISINVPVPNSAQGNSEMDHVAEFIPQQSSEKRVIDKRFLHPAPNTKQMDIWVPRVNAKKHTPEPPLPQEILKKIKALKAKMPHYPRDKFEWHTFLAVVKQKFSSLSNNQIILKTFGINSKSLQQNGDIIDCVSKAIGENYYIATYILAFELKITSEYIFACFPQDTSAKQTAPHKFPIENNIPSEYICNDKVYRLVFTDEQFDYFENKSHAICHYKHGTDDIYIPATVIYDHWTPVLTIGEAASPLSFFSETDISDPFNNDQVFCCMDKEVALLIREKQKDMSIDGVKYIITGYFGAPEDWKNLSISSLKYKTLYIVPVWSPEGLKSAYDFASSLEKKFSCIVKICNQPTFPRRKNVEEPLARSFVPETTATSENTYIETVNEHESFVRTACNNALIVKEFRKFLIDNCILTQDKNHEPHMAQDPLDAILFGQNSEIEDEDIEACTIPHLKSCINKDNIGMIWADTDSAKSFVAQTYAYNSAAPKPLFSLQNSGEPWNVNLLDGEMTEKVIVKRLRTISGNDPNFDKVRKRIKISCVRGLNVNLLDKDFQEKLIKSLQFYKSKVLIIDNIIALCPQATTSTGVDKFFAFLYHLGQLGIATLFVLHSNKDGENYQGSAKLKSKSQTVINIKGLTSIMESDNHSDAVRKAIANKEKNTIIQVVYEKCKQPYTLNSASEIYSLNDNTGWKFVDGCPEVKRIHNELAASETIDSSNELVAPETIDSSNEFPMEIPMEIFLGQEGEIKDKGTHNVNESMTLDLTERRTKAVLEYITNHDRITRVEAQSLLDVGEDVASKLLTSMKKDGLVEMKKNGNNYWYELAVVD